MKNEVISVMYLGIYSRCVNVNMYLLYCRVIGGVCQDVDIGELVTFNVNVEVTECTDELIAGPQE